MEHVSQLSHPLVGKKLWVDYSEFSSNTIAEVTVKAVLEETALVEFSNKSTRLYKLKDLKEKEFFEQSETFIITLQNVVVAEGEDLEYEHQLGAPIFVAVLNIPSYALQEEIDKIVPIVVQQIGDVLSYKVDASKIYPLPKKEA